MTPFPNPSLLEYHRPETLDAAVALLNRNTPLTRPLAGGTHYRRGIDWPEAVVDLTRLPLSGVESQGETWRIGATTTLEALAAAAELPAGLRLAAERHLPRNLRQRATVGGVIASRDSGPLLAALLSLDAGLLVEPGQGRISLWGYIQDEPTRAHLITAIEIPAGRTCVVQEVSRTPVDAPALVVAVGAERSTEGLGRYLAAATGAGQPAFLLPAALLASVDSGEDDAAAMADLPWRSDPRGSKDYRAAMTPILLKRALAALRAQEASHAG